jgi:nicotinate phosphoribosyltransferase
MTSALGLGLDAFVTVRAAIAAGLADSRASFELSLRPGLADWGFLVLAGIEPLLAALERLRVRPEELDWLESVDAIDGAARARLAESKFVCDVDVAPEGSVVFAGEPVVSVEGPFWQAQLVGGLVEAAITDATLVATFFARMRLAAGGSVSIVENGSATAHRMGGAPLLARAAFIGGAMATTSALAGRRHGIPVLATQPSSFELAWSDPDTALRAWLGAAPDTGIVRLAPAASPRSALRAVASVVRSAKIAKPIAIEIGDEDRLGVAREAIRIFREFGLPGPRVFVAGVSERTAVELRSADAPIHGVLVAADAPAGVADVARYELVAIEERERWVPKASPRQAAVAPGRKLILRYFDAQERPSADVAHLTNERLLHAQGGAFIDARTGRTLRLSGTSGAPLQADVMRGGKRVSPPESISVVRDRATRSVASLSDGWKRMVGPMQYPFGMTPQLAALRQELLAQARRPTASVTPS